MTKFEERNTMTTQHFDQGRIETFAERPVDVPNGGARPLPYRAYPKAGEVAQHGVQALPASLPLVDFAQAAPSHHSTIDVWYQGGAMGRVGAGESAFGDRSAPILLGVEANWEGLQDDEANVAWARECVADMRQFSSGGMYLNFPGFLEEGEPMLREAYGENYERLVALKNEYDPTNLFRLNQNIEPTA